MKDYGFVKLYRSLHDWEWYTEPNAMRLFIHFLTTVNYKEKNWQGRIIMPGQTVTSRTKLANELKLSEQEIRTALTRLKSTSNITIEATSKYSLVTVCNWEFYQSREDESTSESTSESTNEQPAINQQSTTTKEYKNNKKEEKEINKHIDYPQMLFDFYLTLGLMKHKAFTSAMRDAISKAMKDNKYTIEDCKLLLERHKMVVDITMNTQFPVKARGLDVFFGQKVYNAKHLICSEYEDGGKYYELYLNDKPQDTVEENKSKPQRTNYGRDEE